MRGLASGRDVGASPVRNRDDARAEIAALAIEPRLVLRPTAPDASRWDVSIEIPDLSHLMFRFPNPMRTSTLTPRISVAIGGQVRLYHAYITTAPARLDAPSTVTLYESSVTDLAGFAVDPDAVHPHRSNTSARLVLIDAVELTWQRARYTDGGHTLITPDDVLVSLSTLQLWLWRRLKAPCIGDRDIARAS